MVGVYVGGGVMKIMGRWEARRASDDCDYLGTLIDQEVRKYLEERMLLDLHQETEWCCELMKAWADSVVSRNDNWKYCQYCGKERP